MLWKCYCNPTLFKDRLHKLLTLGQTLTEDMPWPFEPKKPWREVSLSDKALYKNDISKLEPDQEKTKHIRVMLYGPAGSGKSNFINTMESALRGRITGQALSDAIGYDSFTTKYKTHKVKKERGTYYSFVFTDPMGLEKRFGVRVDDIILALKGHVKEGYEFKPETCLSNDNEFYNSSPTNEDKAHVLVCVVSANTVDLLEDDFIMKMRDVRLAARDLDIPQMAILTKIDEACPEVKSDLKKVYMSKRIEKKVTRLSTSLGIQPNFIYPVKNYHSEVELNDDIDILALMALKQILQLGEDFIDNHL